MAVIKANALDENEINLVIPIRNSLYLKIFDTQQRIKYSKKQNSFERLYSFRKSLFP